MSKNQDRQKDEQGRKAFVERVRIMTGYEVEGVPALSIRAPWSWLIVNGPKDVENRVWPHPPAFRGRFLIHQTTTNIREEMLAAQTLIRERLNPAVAVKLIASFPSMSSFVPGIIGEAVLEDIWQPKGGKPCPVTNGGRTVEESPWWVGGTALTFDQVKKWERAIQCKGALGFFLPKL